MPAVPWCPRTRSTPSRRRAPRPGRAARTAQVAGDRGHQPGQCVPVELVLPAEAVDHPSDRATRDRMTLVVRELDVADHRPIPVGPLDGPQVHACRSTSNGARSSDTPNIACLHGNGVGPPFSDPDKPLTCTNPPAHACQDRSAAELRPLGRMRSRTRASMFIHALALVVGRVVTARLEAPEVRS
jgi:hypothetical protein